MQKYYENEKKSLKTIIIFLILLVISGWAVAQNYDITIENYEDLEVFFEEESVVYQNEYSSQPAFDMLFDDEIGKHYLLIDDVEIIKQILENDLPEGFEIFEDRNTLQNVVDNGATVSLRMYLMDDDSDGTRASAPSNVTVTAGNQTINVSWGVGETHPFGYRSDIWVSLSNGGTWTGLDWHSSIVLDRTSPGATIPANRLLPGTQNRVRVAQN